MTPSPLQLETYTFSDIQITAQDNPNISDANLISANQTFGKARNDNRKWHVLLLIRLHADEGQKPAYLGQFKIEGAFQVDEGWPEDKIEELITSTAPALLYGAIREMIVTLTARSKHGPINLKAVRFMPRKIGDMNQVPDSDSSPSQATVSQA
jgi:preprotein translocase subunit SecB